MCSLNFFACLSNGITSQKMLWPSKATLGNTEFDIIVHLRYALERKGITFLRNNNRQHLLIGDRGT